MSVVVKKLIWDDWNVAHIASHNVLEEEVEEICRTNSQTEVANRGRVRITGLTRKGRIISTFLDPEPEDGVYYPVSARDASKKERRSYRIWSKGGEKQI